MLKVAGTLAQNINYAVKIDYLLPALHAQNIKLDKTPVNIGNFISIIEKYEDSVVLVISE